MVRFDKKTLDTLEFPKVIQQLSSFAVSNTTKDKIRQLQPSSDREKVHAAQDETQDGVTLLTRKEGLPIAYFEDVQGHLKRLDMGGDLNGEEIAQIGRLLAISRDLIRYFDNIQEDDEIELKSLNQLADHLDDLPRLLKEIEVTVDETGDVLDSASPELRRIRSTIQSSQAAVRQILNRMIKGSSAKHLTDNLITMRNDRFVLPVKSESRRHIKGVVHDQSASGQTIYVEPQQVVDHNNQLRQLHIEEKQEEEKILSELSLKIAEEKEQIRHNQALLTHLDFIAAKARYAQSISASRPTFNAGQEIDLLSARHPLLDPEKVVPNDISLGRDYQAIVVTGPNTGGKTIVLKTIGLLQVMGQAGLQIPAEEGSSLAILDSVYADIGDEQSIEQSLSTFSSHMTNIIRILSKISDRSLVLIDELGSGTDPQEGAALAISILEYIQSKASLAMVSSHYPELKSYAYNQADTVNASMTFDVDTLSPTFELQIGIPGRSNAFEISKRLGIPDSIIDRARDLLNDDSQSVDDMITDLDIQRQQASQEYESYREAYLEAFKLKRQLESAYEDLNKERQALLNQAEKEADQKVEKAQEEAEKIISDLRQKQLNLGESVVKEHELIDAQTRLDRMRSQEEKDRLSQNKHIKKARQAEGFQVGDTVQVTSLNQQGTLIEKVGKKSWMVQLGSMKMKVEEKNLERLASAESTKQPSKSGHRTRKPRVGTELDIRGERYEQAMDELSRYLDAALLNNYETVTIIHGHGTGVLREGVHKLLAKHPQVESYQLAPANQGGTGASFVKLKSQA